MKEILCLNRTINGDTKTDARLLTIYLNDC